MATYIPIDLLYEIFSWLPIMSLLRFRCVSSLCRRIIDDPFLAYMHQIRSSEEPNVLIFHHPHNKTEVMLRREGRLNITKASLSRVSKFATLKNYHLKCSCNGLSCFVKRDLDGSDLLILFNPVRNQHVSLRPKPAVYPSDQRPSPGQNKSTYGLGFDRSKNTYKMVRIVLDEKSSSNTVFHGEVFTLGTSSWRVVPKGGPSFPLFGLPVFACGNIHWLTDVKDELDEDEDHRYRKVLSSIVSFDISKEEFGLIYPPKFKWPCHLCELNGKLGIVNYSKSVPHIDIWVLKDYERKDQWIKHYDIDLQPPGNYFFADMMIAEFLGMVECGRIIILSCYGRLFYSDLTNGRLRYVLIPKIYRQTEVLCIKGSLLSISGFQAN